MAKQTKTQTTSKSRTPKLKGEPLIAVPNFTQLTYNAFGREIVNRVNDKFKGTYAEIKPEHYKKNKPITHSNSFRLFAIDLVARGLDAKVMLPQESELLLAQNRLPEAGSVYYDLGLVLDFSGRNHDLAVNLYEKFKSANSELSLDSLPALALGLAPSKSDLGDDGLEFDITPHSQLNTAKILSETSGYFKSDDPELVVSGLPSKLGEGTRYFYVATQQKPSEDALGLSGLCLNRDGNVDSGYSDLRDSSPGGRVVVTGGGGGAPREFEHFVAEIQKQKLAEESLLKKRYEQAIKKGRGILQGKAD